jgi:hypothetical protein
MAENKHIFSLNTSSSDRLLISVENNNVEVVDSQYIDLSYENIIHIFYTKGNLIIPVDFVPNPTDNEYLKSLLSTTTQVLATPICLQISGLEAYFVSSFNNFEEGRVEPYIYYWLQDRIKRHNNQPSTDTEIHFCPDGSIAILLFVDGKLLLVNTFDVQTKEDVLYFLAGVLQTHQLDVASTKVYFSGYHSIKDEAISFLSEHINEVSLYNVSDLSFENLSIAENNPMLINALQTIDLIINADN